MKKTVMMMMAAVVLPCAFTANAATYYVAKTGNDGNPGTDPGYPKLTIQSAVTAASAGSTILVGNGNYAPISTDNKLLTIQAQNQNMVIIDGGNVNRCATLGTLSSQKSTKLDGINLINGNADHPNVTVHKGYGGGAHAGTLVNCRITSCEASGFGGGAAYSQLENCTVSNNKAEYGGGTYYCDVVGSSITGNTAVTLGGGTDNSTLSRCFISGNTAKYGGGAYFSTLNNCILSKNTATVQGGGSYNSDLSNCTIAQNEASHLGGGSYWGQARNSIYWNNICAASPNPDFHTTEMLCCRAGTMPTGSYDKGGNITGDPSFVNGANENYALQSASACINKGMNAYAPLPYDFLGNPRISGGIVDMGAHELQVPAAPAGVWATQGTDLNGIFVDWWDVGNGGSGVPGATSYIVFRGESNVSGLASPIATRNVPDIYDTDVTPGKTYWYWVIALNSAGEGPISESAAGFRAIALTPLTGLTASNGTYTDKVALSWNPVPGAVEYGVRRSLDSVFGNSAYMGSRTTASYDDTGATAGQTYYYWVRPASYAETDPYYGPVQGMRAVAVQLPPAPTNVAATQGSSTDRVNLSWTAANGASSYKVFRNDADATSGAQQIGTSSNTGYQDYTAEPMTNYFYWVKAVNSSGDSAFSSPSAEGWRGDVAPAAPTGVWATYGVFTDRIFIVWELSWSASAYQIFRSESDNILSASWLETVRSSTSYTDNSGVPDVVYYYWVKAVNSAGESKFSSPAAMGLCGNYAPQTPKKVSASQGEYADKVRISWVQSLGAAGYHVLRSTTDNVKSATQLNSTAVTRLFYDDTTATPGTVYYYWVLGEKPNAILPIVSAPSDPSAAGWAAVAPTTAPANVQASTTYTDRIRVTWARYDGADYFNVYRDNPMFPSLVSPPIGTTTTGAFNDTTAEPGVWYDYWVSAVNAAGEGPKSAVAQGYRPYSLTVTYDPNGDNAKTLMVVMAANGNYVLPSTDPVWAGYLFGGWYTEVAGGTQVTASTPLTRTDDHTLWARWRDPLLDYEAWRILNGNLPHTPEHERIWLTDPQDMTAVLRAFIRMEGAGEPNIWWEPNLGILRDYTFMVSTNLTENVWQEITPQELPTLEPAPARFFKVKVKELSNE